MRQAKLPLRGWLFVAAARLAFLSVALVLWGRNGRRYAAGFSLLVDRRSWCRRYGRMRRVRI